MRFTRMLYAALMVAVLCGGLFFARDLSGAAKYHDPGVDLLLVLAADSSVSVDVQEFALQRDGYAAGITAPEVLSAIQGGPYGRIAVVFFEWAGPNAQRILVDWTLISDEESAHGFAHKLLAQPRLLLGGTSISSALEYSVRLLERAPYTSHRRVVDISGDGTENGGAMQWLPSVRQMALEKRIVINGLVILSDVPSLTNPEHTHPPGGLEAYYHNHVTGGPGSFVIAADGFGAFAKAVRRKLVLEIAMKK